MYLIGILVIGALAGWLAGQFMRGSGFGLLGDIVVGMVGSLIGGFIFGILGIYAYGLIGRIVMATIGSVVLLYLVRKLR
ncbi:MAG: GlsB/YeaQ/YmgE family stress response membrane protein [Acidobacteria bacterium]|jgi:uncharacterized membrane protein YeaQ/YmgE (transglycosylase-associated protein family)|nr:MAG: GlsB/YeaQ/YmgE family stress response membrane protein [Acidobacteriota bacterium]PYR50384.1 MAG: GlsB/YeaQ/YmgE family stress response membrane protein [Acidobacteriota bacterium]